MNYNDIDLGMSIQSKESQENKNINLPITDSEGFFIPKAKVSPFKRPKFVINTKQNKHCDINET